MTSTDAATNSRHRADPPAQAPRSFTTPSASLHRHHRRRLRRRHPRRQHLRLRDRQRRGHPEADRGRRSSRAARRCRPAGRADLGDARAAGPAAAPPSPAAALHVDGAFAGTDADLRPRPLARVRGDLRRAPPSSTSASPTTSTAPGRCSAPTDATASSSPAPTPAAAPTDTPLPRPAASARRTATGSSGTRARSATTSTATWSHTHAATFGTDLNVGRQRLQLRRPRALGRLAAHEPLSGLGHLRPRASSTPARRPTGRRSSWTADTPAGTGVALSVRTGNTPTPDGSWSALHPGRLQRRRRSPATPATSSTAPSSSSSDPDQTPTLSDVSIALQRRRRTRRRRRSSQRTPAPNATGRRTQQRTSTSSSASRWTRRRSTARPSGCESRGPGSDVPASVTYAGNTATLDPNADLDPSAVYNVTVAGTVTDANGNPLGADDTWSFTTASLSFIDTTIADFSAGTPGANTYVSETDNGEVTLKPTVGERVLGQLGPGRLDELPLDDLRAAVSGAGATVSGGALHVNGAYARHRHRLPRGPLARVRCHLQRRPIPDGRLRHRPERPAVGDLQHQGRRQHALRAHRQRSGGQPETPLPGPTCSAARTSTGSSGTRRGQVLRRRRPGRDPHRQLRRQHMRAIASDFNSGGPELSVDWMRMSPYPGSGTFDSRVFDAGRPDRGLGRARWNAATPAGTGIAISVRTGNTPTPDGTWSAFTPIASTGGDIPGNTRYVQYRAAADQQRPGPDAGPERRLDRLCAGRGQHSPDDHRPQPVAERHRRPPRHQRPGPVQRADEPGDDRRLERAPAKAGLGHRRPRQCQLLGDHRDARPERRSRSERRLHGHGRRLGEGPGRQRARCA